MDPLCRRTRPRSAPLSRYLVSLASSQPSSPSPRVGSPAALALPFALPRPILTGQPRPARGCGSAQRVNTMGSDYPPGLGVAQAALTAPRSAAPRLLFL
jgi:hypothetical protein